MSLSYIVTILTLALTLLTSTQSNPNATQAQKDQAISVANQAIQTAYSTLLAGKSFDSVIVPNSLPVSEEVSKQQRDSARISDLGTMRSAMALYLADVSAPNICANSNTIYRSDQGGQAIDGTGWLPVDFRKISSGAPIGKLPKDPKNVYPYIYTYACNTQQFSFEFDARIESAKYGLKGPSDIISTDGGNDPSVYEVGTNLQIIGLSGVSNIVSGSQPKARDARRISDLRVIQTQLELYFTKNGKYPDTTFSNLKSLLISADIGVSLSQIPNDPNFPTERYYYQAFKNGSIYLLGAKFEDPSAYPTYLSDEFSGLLVENKVCGKSNNFFCLSLASRTDFTQSTSNVSGPKTIKVISPNGPSSDDQAQELEGGKTYTIQWDSSNVSSVKIQRCLTTEDYPNFSYCGSLPGSLSVGVPASQRQAEWYISPNDPYLPYRGFKLKISDAADPTVYDLSDGTFSLEETSSLAGKISVFTPTPARYRIGDSITVSWVIDGASFRNTAFYFYLRGPSGVANIDAVPYEVACPNGGKKCSHTILGSNFLASAPGSGYSISVLSADNAVSARPGFSGYFSLISP